MTIDPEQEQARLAAKFASMADDELLDIGQFPSELTDIAFLALRQEMMKRNLEWPGKDSPLPSNMAPNAPADDSHDRPVVVRRYRDMPAAFVDKSVLDGAGIDCFLQDSHVVRMDWLWSNAIGGIKLIVRQKDAEDANALLNQPPPETAATNS